MKRLHKIEQALSSIFGSHGHENHSALEEKKDFEMNVEKILNLVNGEQNDTDSSDNAPDKSELVSLINDFNKNYHALYGRYDHLLEKLQKSIRHKKGHNGSVSLKFSSSDSESSSSESEENFSRKDFSNRNRGSKGELEVSVEDYQALLGQLGSLKTRNNELENQAASMLTKLEEHESISSQLSERETLILALENDIQTTKEDVKILQVANERLTQELKTTSENKFKLEQIIESIRNENVVLMSEKSSALSRLHEELMVIEQMKEELGRMESENGFLKQEVEKAAFDVSNLNHQLDIAGKEMEVLREENSTVLSKSLELEKALSDAKHEADLNHKMATEALSSENANLLSENEGLKNKLEIADQEEANLTQKLTAAAGENSAISLELSRMSSKLQEAEKAIRELTTNWELEKDENSRLLEANNNLERQLRVKDEESSSLASKNTVVVEDLQQARGKMEMIALETEKLNRDKSQLLGDLETMKLEVEAAKQEASEAKETLEAMKYEKHLLKSENISLVSNVQQFEKIMEDSKVENERLAVGNSQLLSKINDLGLELEGGRLQMTDITKALGAATEERDLLASEIAVHLSKLEQAENNVRELQVEFEKLKEEKSQLLGDLETTKLEVEAAKKEANEAKEFLEAMKEEKHSLKSENITLVSNVQQLEKIMEDSKAENERLAVGNSQLLTKINDLSLELEAGRLQMTEITKALGVATKERDSLASEIAGHMSKLEQAENNVRELQVEFEKLKEENYILHQNGSKIKEAEKVIDNLKVESESLRADNSQLRTKINELTLQLELANDQSTSLKALHEDTEQEKDRLTSEITLLTSKLEQAENNGNGLRDELEQLEEENSKLQDARKDLQSQNSELEEKLEGKIADLFGLEARFLEAEKDASDRIQAMTVYETDLQKELDLLLVQKSDLEEQIKAMTERSSEMQLSIRSLVEGLRSKIADLESMLNDEKDRFNELLENHNQLEDQYQETCAKLKNAEEKIEEMGLKESTVLEEMARIEESVLLLEAVDKEQKEKITMLEESCKKLSEQLKQSETERADLDKEITRLHGVVQTLEVQTRLTNQKLKITETQNKATEEDQRKMVEELRMDRKELEDRVVALSRRSTICENELKKMKEAVRVGMASLSDLLNNLELVFKENSMQMNRRLAECTGELHAVQTCVAAVVYEKHELQVRMKYKEGVISMLKEEAGIAVSKMAELEKDEEELVRRATDSERKLGELEKRLKETEELVLVASEEKKEAIRQLCLLIEYHRENCNQLMKYIAANLKNKR